MAPTSVVLPSNGARPCSWAGASTAPHLAPQATCAVRLAVSMVTSVSREVTISTPSVAARLKPWPVACTVTVAPRAWAKRTASAMSPTSAATTTTAGVWTKRTFQAVHASTKPASVPARTSPATAARRVAMAVASMVLQVSRAAAVVVTYMVASSCEWVVR